MNEAASPPADDSKRIIVLMYGILDNGQPFWLFSAVRPGKYQRFIAAQKEGELNLYQFDEYGEIIVSGEGRSPPDEVTLKVAEMYQTDPATLLQAANEDPPQETP